MHDAIIIIIVVIIKVLPGHIGIRLPFPRTPPDEFPYPWPPPAHHTHMPLDDEDSRPGDERAGSG